MKYRNIEQFKYQLAENIVFETGIRGFSFKGEFLEIRPDGILTIKYGYLWDGASGPTIDTDSAMFGALVHDALYELMRREVIPTTYKDTIDRLFHSLLIRDGMNTLRANMWYDAVSRFAWHTCVPGSETKDKVLEV